MDYYDSCDVETTMLRILISCNYSTIENETAGFKLVSYIKLLTKNKHNIWETVTIN
jgi:hypothetical protein